MNASFLIGDVFDRLTDIPDSSVDLILTSPPFLALRSYLPDDHPDKAKEIGSEPTPAAFIDVLLELTAAWGRVLAPHGSIAVELGDTYAGSGGAGGDYNSDGLRDGQPSFDGSARRGGGRVTLDDGRTIQPNGIGNGLDRKGPGWPLPKSLACIPQLYQVALAYGINPLTGSESPAGRWRVRTLKPWIRSNPPVGALGDKERPATSYVIVACRAADRWFDLDAVRTKGSHEPHTDNRGGHRRDGIPGRSGQIMNPVDENGQRIQENAGGAPPRDWWHHVDAVLQAELDIRAERYNGGLTERVGLAGASRGISGGDADNPDKERDSGARTVGAQGYHLRRALERAGILTTLEALDVSPKGYSGAHYAVWPPELVRLLVNEMCPRRVCTTCGGPSRRIVERSERYAAARAAIGDFNQRDNGQGTSGSRSVLNKAAGADITAAEHITVGWSECDCPEIVGPGSSRPEAVCSTGSQGSTPGPTSTKWRPGHVLDPFAGSGTTLAVATGMGRTATGIDIDERNAWLASERVGMFLDVDQRPIVDVVDSL